MCHLCSCQRVNSAQILQTLSHKMWVLALCSLRWACEAQAGAVKNELHKTDYRRLNLGVAAAAIALIAVRTIHWDMQSALGHLETVFQGGLTGAQTSSTSSSWLQVARLLCSMHIALLWV